MVTHTKLPATTQLRETVCRFTLYPEKCSPNYLPFALEKCNTVLYTIGVRKKLIAVRLKPEQLKKLERIAVRDDLPISWLIRKAIDEFLKRQK